MKTELVVSLAAFSFSLSSLAFGPGGPGGGGGGNQPDAPGGGGGSFTFDTFLTDATTSGGCIVYGNLMTGSVAGETQLTVPASVAEIADGALAGKDGVVTFDASAATGLVEIPESFAAGCDGLVDVVLPSTVTSVCASAFTMDAALATFTGAGVTAVGDYAFFGCRSLVLSEDRAFPSVGEAALAEVSYVTPAGETYRSEAAPLVDWLKRADGVSLSIRPDSCNTDDLRTWLMRDAVHAESYLYAGEIATNASFAAVSVSGTNFIFAVRDPATRSVLHADLLVSTDLRVWRMVRESEITDGIYSIPSATNGFARAVYSLSW